jgi:hypothetical protein
MLRASMSQKEQRDNVRQRGKIRCFWSNSEDRDIHVIYERWMLVRKA